MASKKTTEAQPERLGDIVVGMKFPINTHRIILDDGSKSLFQCPGEGKVTGVTKATAVISCQTTGCTYNEEWTKDQLYYS